MSLGAADAARRAHFAGRGRHDPFPVSIAIREVVFAGVIEMSDELFAAGEDGREAEVGAGRVGPIVVRKLFSF